MRRLYHKQKYCISHLYDAKSGEYICDALEDCVRDDNHNGKIDGNEKKIPGETAIPCGKYFVTFARTSLDIGKKVPDGCIPILHGVDSFSFIRIHPGETENNSEGCILLGFNKQPGKLTNSEEVCIKFYERMNYRPFWLIISDDYVLTKKQ